MSFDSSFIDGHTVGLPTLSPSLADTAFNAGAAVDHNRFSIIFSERRHLAIGTAHNIDGNAIIPEGQIEREDRFRFDQSVPNNIQIDNNRGYHDNDWDRGHLVRRRSLHWGDKAAARDADAKSFFWTNIAPQHMRLHDSAWGKIEDWMLEHADDGNKKASVFTGPVLTQSDPIITNKPGEESFQLPAGFWKIMVVQHRDELRAAGFLVWQRDFDRDTPVTFDPILEQVRITTLEYLTGLSFLDIRNADPLRFGVTFNSTGPSPASPGRAPRRTIRPGSARNRPAAITTAADIVL